MDYPTVSVIVLNHNGRQFMEDCFGSLGRLEYPADAVELVLADNASSDGSPDLVAEKFPHVRVLRFGENHGFSAGNNRAVRESKSEYVAFLNSDMRVDPGWLVGLVGALDRSRGAICASSKILSWDGKAIDFGGILLSFLGHGRADGYLETDTAAYDDVRDILAPCGGAMLISREVFEEVGGFDEDFFMYFEDIDLGWRLWIQGYEVAFAPSSICYHVHFGSTSEEQKARVGYLYERNALFTIIKNYEQSYLDRVLPLALLMHFKRAYLLGAAAGIDMDRCRFNASTAQQVARSDAQEEDPRASIRDAGAHWLQQAHLAAVNDLIEGSEGLMKKRHAIQSARRRSDEEIFSRIRKLSFGVCFDTPEYRRSQDRLVDLFGIEQLFGPLFDRDIPFALRVDS